MTNKKQTLNRLSSVNLGQIWWVYFMIVVVVNEFDSKKQLICLVHELDVGKDTKYDNLAGLVNMLLLFILLGQFLFS